jgi:hypothetical protein
LVDQARPEVDVLHLETLFVSEIFGEGSVHHHRWGLYSFKDTEDLVLEESGRKTLGERVRRGGAPDRFSPRLWDLAHGPLDRNDCMGEARTKKGKNHVDIS